MLQKAVNRGTAAIVPLILGLSVVIRNAGADARPAQFTSGVNLVEVYATVTDRDGQPVTGLRADDFQVAEDDRPQPVTAFAAGEFPLSVALAIDRSFSMRGERLTLAKQAARAFIDALRPADEVMVIAIGSEVETIAEPEPAASAARTRWDRIDAWGTTPLYDAILTALRRIETRKGRRALVVLSDGDDRYSEVTATELVQQARRLDALVYPIAIDRHPPVFAELAAVTGGRAAFLKNARDLEATLAAVARELRFQYLLGYVPQQAGTDAARWHSIQVSVDRPDVRVRARDGYFSK